MSSILVAIMQDSSIFLLTGTESRDDLKKIKQHQLFKCPQCEEPVILKIGSVKIPHFAHKKHTTCVNLFAEGETMKHLQGKQQLYKFFMQKTKLKVSLEPYLKMIAQRPDLLLYDANTVQPIEFQCSVIPKEKMTARTGNYLNVGMRPLWILSTSEKIQQLPKGITHYSLTHFEEQFLIQATNSPFLFTYCPIQQQFHYLTNFLHVENRKYIVSHRNLSMEQQSYPFAIPKALTKHQLENYCQLFFAERKHFIRNEIRYNRQGVNHPFLRTCYELRIIPSDLPLWIGVPIAFNDGFSSHSVEWQLALIKYLLSLNKTLLQVTRKELSNFHHVTMKHSKQAKIAVQKYVQLLVDLDINLGKNMFFQPTEKNLQENILRYLQNEKKIEKI